MADSFSSCKSERKMILLTSVRLCLLDNRLFSMTSKMRWWTRKTYFASDSNNEHIPQSVEEHTISSYLGHQEHRSSLSASLPCFSKFTLYISQSNERNTLLQSHQIIKIIYIYFVSWSINLFPARRHDDCFTFDCKRPSISPCQAIISDAGWLCDK